MAEILQHSTVPNGARRSDTEDTAAHTRQVLLDFFRRTGVSYHFRWAGMNVSVKTRVLEIANSWDLGLPSSTIEKYLTVGLVIAITAYGHTSLDIQVSIALYTFCCTMADDNVLSLEMLREFPPRFFDGLPQRHPVLTHLVNYLAVLRQQYSAFSGNVITSNTLDFFAAEMFLRDEGGSELHVQQASSYVDYLRWKTGIGEAYAAFIWPKAIFVETRKYIQAMPDALQFICLCNDLFSYHKEAKAGETDNYVSQHTAIYRQTALETLQQLVDRIVVLDERIKTVLGDGPEKRAWELFAGGYTEFHLYTPRYQLEELLPEYYH